MKKRLVCIGLALALLAGLSLTAAAEDLELPAPSCILMEKQTGIGNQFFSNSGCAP